MSSTKLGLGAKLVAFCSGLLEPAIAELLSPPRYFLVLRITLLLLLLYGSSTVFLDVPLRIICSLMLIIPSLLTNQILWVLICGFVWWVNASDWLWIDNHKILISYWCLVCALAVSSSDPEEVLARNGRMLIGLTFFFATVWKMIAGEYWNGAFLHYTFLAENRIEEFANIIGGLPPDVLPQNQILSEILSRFPGTVKTVTLASNPRLEIFSLAASYWTLLIEGSIALAFLGKSFRFLFRFRNWLLILFIVTTYFLLPVLGFAYILIVMGLAQCSGNSRYQMIAYIFLLGFLQFARFF
ncbi:hypothetical protein Xen7305DRAFT_00045080 [Xenococcus sp. PCC 7305]|uniref:hypothetical protein n=1 Tax=Xenococcus sp. PCC 7305 TaxID=102125 RepID=UPI0002ACED1C|nr:hypothetical protein [Xenococcus sp. PCC 7305]ELS04772.1 hypothetical protein Xen7305DRAFT_00045080 [Xenococcus sp. PCC 7305]